MTDLAPLLVFAAEVFVIVTVSVVATLVVANVAGN